MTLMKTLDITSEANRKGIAVKFIDKRRTGSRIS
jgi:hypothetical protein